jgi:hypothetical protein
MQKINMKYNLQKELLYSTIYDLRSKGKWWRKSNFKQTTLQFKDEEDGSILKFSSEDEEDGLKMNEEEDQVTFSV